MSDNEASSDWSGTENDDLLESDIEFNMIVKSEVDSDREKVHIKQEIDEDNFERVTAQVTYTLAEEEPESAPRKKRKSGAAPALAPSPTSRALLDYMKRDTDLQDAGIATVDQITSDDEIWTLQCPSNFDPKSLIGVELPVQGTKKVKIPNSKYDCVKFDAGVEDTVDILMPSTQRSDCKILRSRVEGGLVIRERFGHAKDYIVNVPPETTVPFPTNLKVRHPLFGCDYEERITLPTSVVKRLKKIEERRSKRAAKKSKSAAVENETREKVKKRRRSEDVEPVSNKKQKNKHLWESETGIEQSLFNVSVNKKKSKNKS